MTENTPWNCIHCKQPRSKHTKMDVMYCASAYLVFNKAWDFDK